MRPELPEKPPKPPDFLSAAAKAEWDRLAPELHRLGLLTVLDHGPFAALCQATAMWSEVLEAEAIEADPATKAVLAGLAADWSRSMLPALEGLWPLPAIQDARPRRPAGRPGAIWKFARLAASSVPQSPLASHPTSHLKKARALGISAGLSPLLKSDLPGRFSSIAQDGCMQAREPSMDTVADLETTLWHYCHQLTRRSPGCVLSSRPGRFGRASPLRGLDVVSGAGGAPP